MKFQGKIEELHRPYTTRVRVRYGETDAMGVVYYGNYPLYFEVGRNETMRAYGFPYGRLESEGIMMPVVDMYLRYVTPARYDDELDITTGFLDLRGATLLFGYVIRRVSDNALIVWGNTTMAFLSCETRRPHRAPALLIERINFPNEKTQE